MPRTASARICAVSLRWIRSSSSGSSAGGIHGRRSTPTQGGTIYYAHDLEIPCLQGGWVEEAYIERQYTDSLVSQASSGHDRPLARHLLVGLRKPATYTFHLKPNVKFSDGTPLNAQAVADNFDFWTNPKTGNSDVDAYIGPYFKSAVATGPLTVQVNLKKPYSPLLSSLSQGYDGILSPKGLARGVNANCDDPIGSGPFILKSGTTARTSCLFATRTTTPRRRTRCTKVPRT